MLTHLRYPRYYISSKFQDEKDKKSHSKHQNESLLVNFVFSVRRESTASHRILDAGNDASINSLFNYPPAVKSDDLTVL